MNDSTQRLSALPTGRTVFVRSITPNRQALRLREMGLWEGQSLEVLCAGDPMICRVGACRVGICAKLASEVRVTS